MADTTEQARGARRARHERILAEVAQEEAEAVEAEIAETAGTLDIPRHLRTDRELDSQLRQRAAAEHIPTSALVRRLLRQTVREHGSGGLTVAAGPIRTVQPYRSPPFRAGGWSSSHALFATSLDHN